MKCIISDFDGTLYDDNFLNNIESIKKFVLEGYIFIINTGRTFESIKNAIKNYNIPYKYLICSDGASIYDENDNMIYSKYLDDDLKKEIHSFLLKNKDIKKIMFDNNYTLTSNVNEKVSRCFGTSFDKKIDRKIADELNKNSHIKAYLSANWINILDNNINKMVAIKYLETSLGTIYSVGDSINDIEMLEEYNGYLMEKNEIGKCNLPTISSVEKLVDKILKDT